jgi:hypothetical protein
MPFGNPYLPAKRPSSSSGARHTNPINNNQDERLLRPKSAAAATPSVVRVSTTTPSNINESHIDSLSDPSISQVSNNRFIAEKLFISNEGMDGGDVVSVTPNSVTASTSETLAKLSFAEKLQVMIMQMNNAAVSE